MSRPQAGNQRETISFAPPLARLPWLAHADDAIGVDRVYVASRTRDTLVRPPLSSDHGLRRCKPVFPLGRLMYEMTGQIGCLLAWRNGLLQCSRGGI